MVAPNSPARKAGVERGYCFQKINGQRITSRTQLESLLSGSASIDIEFIYPQEKTISLRKEYYWDSPVHFDSIYDLSPVTGYLVYTHFTDGNNNSYYNELRAVFAKFLRAGVENIILDLRYNGGGELTAARRMASLLAPPRYLGGIYLYKERNSSYGDPAQFESEALYTSPQMSGYNCGDINLYIITGSTTASASELVIHCLRPLYDQAGLKFLQVGAETYGKNVGGTVYASNRYEWEVSPVTLRVHNIHRVSGYEDGLQPDISSVERHSLLQLPSGEYVIPVGDWGDIQNELMLQDVMNDIYGYGGWTALIPPDGSRAAALSRTAVALAEKPQTEGSTLRVYPLVEKRVVIP
ncbi:MAG: S41 family peptidase, partial [Alistipes sp.]|nr:S41 family peptidase [Alistipes sp.]